MNDAVTKRGGNNFAGDWVMDDKSNSAAGLIIMRNDSVTEINEIFAIIKLKTVLIDGAALTFTGFIVGYPEFV